MGGGGGRQTGKHSRCSNTSRSRSLPPNADESPWERDSGPHQRACGKVGLVTGPFTQSHSVLTTLPEDRLCTACQRAVSAPKQNKTGRTEEKRKEAAAGPPGLQAALVGSVRGSADASRMRRHGRRKPEGGPAVWKSGRRRFPGEGTAGQGPEAAGTAGQLGPEAARAGQVGGRRPSRRGEEDADGRRALRRAGRTGRRVVLGERKDFGFDLGG